MNTINKSPASGFTLVELLITISLIAFVMLSGLPYTSAWVDNAKVIEAEGALNEGVSRAKSIAMRNLYATQGDAAASALCLSDSNLVSLHVATPSSAATCATTRIWSQQISEQVQLSADDLALTQLCFTNKGQITQTDCDNGLSHSNILITAGTENVTVSYL